MLRHRSARSPPSTSRRRNSGRQLRADDPRPRSRSDFMRSLLFVPGDSEKKLAKALESGADALILDLEDSVALAAKPQARGAVAAFIGATQASVRRPRLYVRVNPLDGGLTEADLDVVMAAGPDGIMLPKSFGGADVQRLGVKLAVREADHGLADGATRILAIATESARALFGLASYAGASARLDGLAWAPRISAPISGRRLIGFPTAVTPVPIASRAI